MGLTEMIANDQTVLVPEPTKWLKRAKRKKATDRRHGSYLCYER